MEAIVDYSTCIPNEDELFYRVHKNDYRDGELVPGAFQERGAGMSTDWSKFATAYECLTRSTEFNKNGESRLNTHGIVSLIAGEVREIDFLSVVYAPSKNNKAHTNVCGIPPNNPNKAKVRFLLHKIHRTIILAPIEP